jgi:hypothetical protein
MIKGGGHLGAKCIVLDQNSRADVDVVKKNTGSHDEGVLGHES